VTAFLVLIAAAWLFGATLSALATEWLSSADASYGLVVFAVAVVVAWRRREAVVRAAAGRLVLLYLPTYSPWRNPIELLWRHFRREVTHCECFPTKQALLAAARDFFAHHNLQPQKILSVIGSKATNLI